MSAIMIEPIKEYDKYFVQNSNIIFGIGENGPERITFIATKEKNEIIPFDFFAINGIIYFGIDLMEKEKDKDDEEISVKKQYFYKQEKSTVTNIDELPEKPEQTRIEYASNNFSITIENFEGTPVSDLKNIYFKNGVRFRAITGAYEIETGIIFNVSKSGIRSKKEGLYFFPLNRTSCSKIKEKGEIY